MNLALRKIDEDNLQDANKCDASFTVDSKLVLNSKDGVIRYSVVRVEPYLK